MQEPSDKKKCINVFWDHRYNRPVAFDNSIRELIDSLGHKRFNELEWVRSFVCEVNKDSYEVLNP